MGKTNISVAIATHNRLPDLKESLKKLEGYRSSYFELIICADGCTDGTSDFVRENYPEVNLLINTHGSGSVSSRNQMMAVAKSSLVLLLDDDSYPVTKGFFEICQKVMDYNPEVGILTFPQRSNEFAHTIHRKDFGPNAEVGTFTSSGAVLRKDLLIKLGGFPDFFFHSYEEPDFSLRAHACGYKIVQWSSLVI